MQINGSNEFSFFNIKRYHFFLFLMSPLILLILFLILDYSEFYKIFFSFSGKIFNIIVYTILFIQIVMFFLAKKSFKLFKIKTVFILSNEGISIKTEDNFFFKKQNIVIRTNEMNSFIITEYAFNPKNFYSISFSLYYFNEKYTAFINLNDEEKNFVNRLIQYLKDLKEKSINPEFCFKYFWLAKSSTRKFLKIWLGLIFASFFFILFEVDNKTRAFPILIAAGLLIQIIGSSKNLAILNDKIEKNDFPIV